MLEKLKTAKFNIRFLTKYRCNIHIFHNHERYVYTKEIEINIL